MRVSHELDKGIVCEKCNKVSTKESGYKRINVLEPIVEDSTGRYKTIHRMNLCRKCYGSYKELLKRHFTNKAGDNKWEEKSWE